MMQVFHQITDVEPITYQVVVMLCVIAALLTREVIGGIYVAVAAVPVYIASSLICIFLGRKYELVLSGDPAVEAIMASVVGMTAIFLFVLIFKDVCRTFIDWRVNKMVQNRKLVNRVSEHVHGRPHSR